MLELCEGICWLFASSYLLLVNEGLVLSRQVLLALLDLELDRLLLLLDLLLQLLLLLLELLLLERRGRGLGLGACDWGRRGLLPGDAALQDLWGHGMLDQRGNRLCHHLLLLVAHVCKIHTQFTANSNNIYCPLCSKGKD